MKIKTTETEINKVKKKKKKNAGDWRGFFLVGGYHKNGAKILPYLN